MIITLQVTYVLSIARNLSDILDAFCACGHEVNLSKTKLWIPGCDDIHSEVFPQELRHLCSQVTRATGGLAVMGGACQGEYETVIGPHQMLLEPARERLQKAKLLATRIVEICDNSREPTRLHVAWCALSKWTSGLSCSCRGRSVVSLYDCHSPLQMRHTIAHGRRLENEYFCCVALSAGQLTSIQLANTRRLQLPDCCKMG